MGKLASKQEDKIVGHEYVTDDLSKFKYRKGNREVTENKALRRSIEKHGVRDAITVNHNMEVVEGQHRLAFARELGIPIKYKFDDNTLDVAEFNSTHKSWRLTDYIHRFVSLDNENYIKLQEFLDDYSALRVSATVASAMGATTTGYKRNELVKNGEFVFRNSEAYTAFAESYTEFIRSTGFSSNNVLQTAYFNLFILKGFDADRFKKKVVQYNLPETMSGVRTLYRLVRTFVDANNTSLRPSSKNFLSFVEDDLGRGTFQNEFNTDLVEEITPIPRRK